MGGGQYKNHQHHSNLWLLYALPKQIPGRVRESNLKESLHTFVGDSQKQKARGSLNHWTRYKRFADLAKTLARFGSLIRKGFYNPTCESSIVNKNPLITRHSTHFFPSKQCNNPNKFEIIQFLRMFSHSQGFSNWSGPWILGCLTKATSGASGKQSVASPKSIGSKVELDGAKDVISGMIRLIFFLKTSKCMLNYWICLDTRIHTPNAFSYMIQTHIMNTAGHQKQYGKCTTPNICLYTDATKQCLCIFTTYWNN